MSTSINDGVIELNKDGGVDVLITDDPICLFTSDTLEGENFVADISALKKLKCLFREDEFEETFNDNDGIAVILIEPPGHSCRVSFSINNGIDVLLVDNDHP